MFQETIKNQGQTNSDDVIQKESSNLNWIRLDIDVAASHGKESSKILGLQSNTLQTRPTQVPSKDS